MNDAMFMHLVREKINSGTGVLWIYASGDEERVERLMRRIATGEYLEGDKKKRDADNLGKKLLTWDMVQGGSWQSEDERRAEQQGRGPDPLRMLNSLTKLGTNHIVVARDLHLLLNAQGNFTVRRALLELCKDGGFNSNKYESTLVIVADNPAPHPDIKDHCDVVDFPLPDAEYMVQVLTEIRKSWLEGYREACREAGQEYQEPVFDPAVDEKIVQSLLGMTSAEATRILAYASRTVMGFGPRILEVISDEKIKFIRKIDGLTFVPHSKIASQHDLGGYESFVEFLQKRSRAYTRHAQEVGLERPRGVVLIGPPGCGKTVAAKAAARVLGLDLVLMDLSAMLDIYVGSSEKKLRAALAVVSAMPNCLAVVD